MKRLSIFVVTAALIAAMVGCDGDGYTPSEDLEIRTWYDLDDVRDNLAGNHTLMNDLDSTTAGYTELASPTANGGKGWQPIGIFHPYGQTAFTGFMGSFDGQGYEIRDLFINRPDEEYVGLFRVDGGGVIKNIGVVNATVTGYSDVGGLVGYNGGTVNRAYSSGNVTGDSRVGGLVGYNYKGTVSNSYSTGSVTGDEYVGGLVGYNSGSGYPTATISNSYSTGNVTGNEHVGGLVGLLYKGIVSHSFWDTETSGQPTGWLDAGTGKNTTEMMDIATFSGAGWNITAVAPGSTNTTYIWNIVNGVTYPFLSWQS